MGNGNDGVADVTGGVGDSGLTDGQKETPLNDRSKLEIPSKAQV